MDKKVRYNTSDEVIAAFLDGNASAQESQAILAKLSEDAELRELLRISQMVDAELGLDYKECCYLPVSAMAASCEEGPYCCLECEKHILDAFDIPYDDEQMMSDAVQNGWQKENGTALHNVGRHLEKKGLVVTRVYGSSIEDIQRALDSGEGVIVAVDGGELLRNGSEEAMEDLLVGKIPDHTVVVLSLDLLNKIIKIYDPNSVNPEDTYPLSVFEDAWSDSHNYLVTIHV